MRCDICDKEIHGLSVCSECVSEMMLAERQVAYKQGFIAACTAFAVWRNGEQWCGINTLLKDVIKNPETIYNYNPPK